MIVERLLAGNVFRENQRRFRNMINPNPLDLAVTYKYELNILWCYKTIETIGKAVSCASWCHINGDLLAIGYGVYNFISFSDRLCGYVCVWSIKVYKILQFYKENFMFKTFRLESYQSGKIVSL